MLAVRCALVAATRLTARELTGSKLRTYITCNLDSDRLVAEGV